MKPLLYPLFILGAASTAAHAQTEVSDMLATQGLSATEAQLASLASPTPSEQFALGGVRFLGAIETALQTRYNTGINEGLAVESGLPILRLPLPPNPNPAPFTPDVIATMFTEISAELALALEPLDTIGDDDDVALQIRVEDLWFDIDQNGQRGEGESVLAVMAFAMGNQFDADIIVAEPQLTPPSLTIQFDTADAAWLSAYAHLLSGVSETILAVDPTEAITRVLASREAFAELSPLEYDPDLWFQMTDFADAVDLFSMFIMAFDQPADATHSRAAHAHFLGMIEDNKVFWSRVAAETDNTLEWIPNKNQQSALPIDFPEDLAPRWQAVLADAERLLLGETLLPFWRLGDGAGMNVAAFFQDPPHLDPAGLLQGETLLPYMERGTLINSNSLRQFEQLMGGDAGLFMVILN